MITIYDYTLGNNKYKMLFYRYTCKYFLSTQENSKLPEKSKSKLKW